jgi:choline dehydrogenase-like flavoprotein
MMRAIRWALPSIRPRHFAHLTFAIENPGFLLAKKVLFAIQARELPRMSPNEVTRGTSGLAALAFSRLVRHRLHVPASTPIALQLDVEQERSEENSVQLGREVDRFNRPQAVLTWGVSPLDLENLRTLQKSLLGAWATLGGIVPRLCEVALDGSESKLHDAYHPVGTTRMGDDSTAVVDRSLRVRGISNLFALSTGVFPRAGGANPTFSLLCLAQKLSNLLRGDPF